ncbi:MAG TPA: DUF3300 domain-containing protein [Gammaproteobacteria bacterium]|nr:DUF3300 domain-containing protein [Gammaproteobacteria bacterium]
MRHSTAFEGAPRAACARAAALLLGASFWLVGPAFGQEPAAAPAAAPTAAPAPANLTQSELEDLVGRIALYPDDLIAIILPASTYPLQIVEAERFEERHKSDSSLTPNESWDDSIVALLNYPEVLKLMNDDLEWTSRLGDAVASQQADVFDAIQSFRDRALASGSLRSDEHQTVTKDQGEVEIKPADPQVVYVPYYEPERVVVYREPIYYYPFAYPLYYYPYPAGYVFHTGFFWGVSTAFVIGWHSHFLHVNPCTFVGHPYFGFSYYEPFYVRRSVNINVNVNLVHGSHGGYVWHPSPVHRVRYAHPATRSYEGRYRGQYSARSTERLYDERRYTGTTSSHEGRAAPRAGAAGQRSTPSVGYRATTRAATGTRAAAGAAPSSPASRSAASPPAASSSAASTSRYRAAPRTPETARSAPPEGTARYTTRTPPSDRSSSSPRYRSDSPSTRDGSPRLTYRSDPSASYRSGPSASYRSGPSASYRSEPSTRYRSAPSPSDRSAPSASDRSAPSASYRSTPSPSYRSAPSASNRSAPSSRSSGAPRGRASAGASSRGHSVHER